MKKSGLFMLAGVMNLMALSPLLGEDLPMLDLIRLNTFRLQAADTSVMLYIGWNHDDPKAFKETARTALYEVNRLIQEDESMNSPAELKELLDSQISALKKQALLYQGITAHGKKGMEKGYKALNDELEAFFSNLEKAVEADEKARALPDSEPQLKEEMKFCANLPDAKAYQEGVELIRAKKYAQAMEKLQSLLKPYQGTAFGACVALRISDILAMGWKELTPVPGGKKDEDTDAMALGLLTDIVEGDPYSPVLFEAYLKWRTLTQMDNHGMSNFSEIPNDEYNQMRERALRRVRNYQKTHPKDSWAKEQADGLLIQPNIERGGLAGNTNLDFWGGLYSDPRYYYDPREKKKE